MEAGEPASITLTGEPQARLSLRLKPISPPTGPGNPARPRDPYRAKSSIRLTFEASSA